MRILVLLQIALLLSACTQNNKVFSEINGLTQGTTYHIVFEQKGVKDISEVREGIERILKEVDNSLSIYNDSSVISELNSNVSHRTDSLFRDVFRKSMVIWRASGGVFDVSVGPLVKAWGFGPDALKRFDESMLDSLMNLVGMEKLKLEGDRLLKADPGMYIDVNAIAQGYTVDLLTLWLEDQGIENCLVEVGGEVRALGDKDGNGWRIGIDSPGDGNFVPGADMKAIIRLSDISLATSGNYRKFYVENGIKYSHTIDPRTGYPVRHTLLSATILASDCATADAWATACMVAGLDSAVVFIETNKDLEGYLIFSGESGVMKTWMSEGIRKMITEE